MHFRHLFIVLLVLLVSCKKSDSALSAASDSFEGDMAGMLDSIGGDTVCSASDSLMMAYARATLAGLQHRFRDVGADAFFNYLARKEDRGYYLADGYTEADSAAGRMPLDIYQVFGLKPGPATPRFYGSKDQQALDLQGAVRVATTLRYRCDSLVNEHPYYGSLVHADSAQFNESGTQTNLRQYLGLMNLQSLRRDAKGRITCISDSEGKYYHFNFLPDGNMLNCMSLTTSGRRTYSAFRYNREGDVIEMNQLIMGDQNCIRKSYYRVLRRDSYGNWTERMHRELIDRQHEDVVDSLLFFEKRIIQYY